MAAVCASGGAQASPSPAIEAAAGGRVSLISGAELLGRVAGSASLRWSERWHAGVRFSADLNRRTQIFEPSGELGLWLHASTAISVLIGWRIGYANFRFEDVIVHAFAAEPIAQIVYPLGARYELHFTPITVQAYLSGVWQFTLGTEVGLAWRW